jgi:hypothetical protein
MMIEESHRHVRAAIAAHFAGAAAPAAERQMRTHLPECTTCHAYYEQYLLLSTLDPAGLSSEVRLARGLGLRPPRAPGGVGFWWLGLCGAAVAALALVYLPFAGGGRGRFHRGQSDVSGAGEMTTRGSAASVAAARTPEVQIYRFAHDAPAGVAERAGEVIQAADELAFAYRNPGGMERLLVFAVDEHGHVYWYHPGWSDAADNPTAVSISTEPGLHELPAAVLHKFDGERIMIHALFTDRELSVRQIEGALAAMAREPGPRGVTPLVFPGAIDVVRPLRIQR